MKKLISLLLCLSISLFGLTAFAEDEDYDNGGSFDDATNLYTIEAAGFRVALPSIVTVTSETENEQGAIEITLAIDGREDCEIYVTLNIVEEYAGLTMMTLPQEELDNFISYYTSVITCENTPEILVLSEDEDEAVFNPLFVSGRDEEGYGYAIYVGLLGGLQLTTALTYTADSADQENLGALLNTYIQFFDAVVHASSEE